MSNPSLAFLRTFTMVYIGVTNPLFINGQEYDFVDNDEDTIRPYVTYDENGDDYAFTPERYHKEFATSELLLTCPL